MALIRRGEAPEHRGGWSGRPAVDDSSLSPRTWTWRSRPREPTKSSRRASTRSSKPGRGTCLSARRFGASSTDDDGLVAYTWPRGGIVGCDLTSICSKDATPPSRMRSSTISWTCGWRSRISAGTAISLRSATNLRWFPRTSTMRSSTPATSPKAGSSGRSGRKRTPDGAWDGSGCSRPVLASRRPRLSTSAFVIARERDQGLRRSPDPRPRSRSSRRVHARLFGSFPLASDTSSPFAFRRQTPRANNTHAGPIERPSNTSRTEANATCTSPPSAGYRVRTSCGVRSGRASAGGGSSSNPRAPGMGCLVACRRRA